MSLRLHLISLLLCVAACLFGQEVIGHRGSIWGVENTREAYLKGVEAGYWALECDVRTTADTVFVLSHDEDLKRLGCPDATIAERRWPELAGLTLTQTRAGRQYTAQLCTLAEYLDICRTYDKVAVIELKWATGVNSNDQSLMPQLMAQIAEKGMLDHAIILTSMRPCLEWIRRQPQYADVHLMWLCTPTTEPGRLEWCQSLRLDIDIRKDFDPAIVPLYRAAGLKVGVWTVDDPVEAEALLPQVDFLTTDSILPRSK